MRSAVLLALATLGVLGMLNAPTWAQQQPPAGEELQRQIDELRARLQQLEAELAATRERQEAAGEERKVQAKPKPPAAPPSRVQVSGYVQSELRSDQASDPQTEFRVRRARLEFVAPMGEAAGVVLKMDAAEGIETRDAYVQVRSGQAAYLRLGQTKVPFMYEVLESSSDRLEPERTVLATTLFPGQRDVGLWAQLKQPLGVAAPGATLDLGVMNGAGPNTRDNNGAKDWVARLRFALGGRPVDKDTETDSLYVAFLRGRFTDAGGVTTDRERLGAGVSYLAGPLWLRGEVVAGRNLGREVFGWYCHLAYPAPDGPGTIFARWERCDEDRDTPDTDFQALTLGYQRVLDPKTRLVLAREFRRPDPGYSRFAKSDGAVTTLRVQVDY